MRAAPTKSHRAPLDGDAAPRTRAERVVRAVLDAAIEEMGRVGFRAFTIEEVARRAGVNKTTVYRRWPTKSALAQAAFERFGEAITAPDTGSLEGDLSAFIHSKHDLAKTPKGRALIRGLHAEGLDPELFAISRRLRKQELALYETIFEQARARGEIRAGVECELLMQVLEGALSVRFLLEGRLAGRAEVKRILDLVLRGALAPR
jgi:AcrR family transcriptional regulator